MISNSPTDTQPVFDAIVRSGLNLFPDAVVTISLPDRDLIKLGAIGGADEAGVEAGCEGAISDAAVARVYYGHSHP